MAEDSMPKEEATVFAFVVVEGAVVVVVFFGFVEGAVVVP
jgi:hypothetical protein